MVRNSGIIALIVVAGIGIGSHLWAQQGHADHAAAPSIAEAVAIVQGTKGNEKVSGVVRFTDTGKGVKVVAEVQGLSPNGTHGFHIHEFGDASAPDGMSAGSHYNPEKHEHGKPGDDKAHVGDMGNLKADDKGVAKLEVLLSGATIAGMKNAILGRSVIVHAKADDFSQPVGNAGPRIGIGIIGVAQPPKKG